MSEAIEFAEETKSQSKKSLGCLVTLNSIEKASFQNKLIVKVRGSNWGHGISATAEYRGEIGNGFTKDGNSWNAIINAIDELGDELGSKYKKLRTYLH